MKALILAVIILIALGIYALIKMTPPTSKIITPETYIAQKQEEPCIYRQDDCDPTRPAIVK